jgi:hypothetical protein
MPCPRGINLGLQLFLRFYTPPAKLRIFVTGREPTQVFVGGVELSEPQIALSPLKDGASPKVSSVATQALTKPPRRQLVLTRYNGPPSALEVWIRRCRKENRVEPPLA